MRVLLWILDRCEGKVGANETAIGYLPKKEDLNLTGLDISDDTLTELLSIDKEVWLKETEGIGEFFAKFGDKLPKELAEELDNLKKRLSC